MSLAAWTNPITPYEVSFETPIYRTWKGFSVIAKETQTEAEEAKQKRDKNEVVHAKNKAVGNSFFTSSRLAQRIPFIVIVMLDKFIQRLGL